VAERHSVARSKRRGEPWRSSFAAEQEGGRGRLDANGSYVAGQASGQQPMNSMDIVTNRARDNSAQSAVSIEKSLCPAQEFGAVVALGDGVLL
jgi:hypothetical protein